MAFTDRYIGIPTKIYDGDQRELLGTPEKDMEMVDVVTKINPFKIESYRPSISRDVEFTPDNTDTVSIYMESGEGHIAFMRIEEFEKLLNDFSKQT